MKLFYAQAQRIGLSLIFCVTAFAVQKSDTAQPVACVTSAFSAIDAQHGKTVTLTLENQCGRTVDFQNALVTFHASTAIDTPFWGNFAPLSYPDNTLQITSTRVLNNYSRPARSALCNG